MEVEEEGRDGKGREGSEGAGSSSRRGKGKGKGKGKGGGGKRKARGLEADWVVGREWVAGKHANGALDMNSGTRVAYKQGLVAGQLLQLVLFVYQVTYFATIEFTGAVYKATHFAADVVHGREGYLYIENDQKKLRGWVSADGSQPTESEKKKGKRSADGTTAGYVLSYVLFPVLVAVERILIAFLEANGFLAVLGACTLHLHGTPFFLRPHGDVPELDCSVVVVQIMGESLLMFDHEHYRNTKKTQRGWARRVKEVHAVGEKKLIAEMEAQLKARPCESGAVGQGESGKLSCRAHFLQNGQKGCIDETSHNYSSVLLKPGDVVVMESGYAIPHQSNKRSVKATAAAAWDYNGVLVYYQAKCDTKQHN